MQQQLHTSSDETFGPGRHALGNLAIEVGSRVLLPEPGRNYTRALFVLHVCHVFAPFLPTGRTDHPHP